MCNSDDLDLRRYNDDIASALRTEGGHLSIGRGGFTLYYARGAYLSGYDSDRIKSYCIAAGLPVIDSRMVPYEAVVRLAVLGPMVAVGEGASGRPYHALSYAPLSVLANRYRSAGAEVFNISEPITSGTSEE